MPHTPKHGYTLLEMSIVLLILALIGGAIVGGESLVNAWRIRSILTETNMYITALDDFKSRYNGYPGDISDATSLWSEDAACPNTPTTTVTHRETCNGNANGRIADIYGDGTTNNPQEIYRAWQQLSNAGYISQPFTGVTGPGGTNHSVIGVNVPASRAAEDGGYALYYFTVYDGNIANWPRVGHMVALGTKTANGLPQGNILTPQDSSSIDQKIDDGKPAYGRVGVGKPGGGISPDCATSDTADAALYKISYDDIACAPLFMLD